jgi:hypothetical protein
LSAVLVIAAFWVEPHGQEVEGGSIGAEHADAKLLDASRVALVL